MQREPGYASPLKALLASDGVTYAMEAHDGMSARIADEAGFAVLWASGLCISTASGVRDANELAWSDILKRVQEMSSCTDLPILVDGDSGHGNYNSTRLFARHAEKAGAQGVCFEDKLFPKMNSFYGDGHDLAETREFMVKIAAARDAVSDDFVLVARSEGLVADIGMEETLVRASAYVDAGADAIFIHSRRSDPVEITEFCRRWDNRVPLVIAPTTYGASLTPEAFEALGVSLTIWANQSLRAAYKAMQQVTRHLAKDASLLGMPPIASVQEIFEHYDYPEMDTTERRLVAWAESSVGQHAAARNGGRTR